MKTILAMGQSNAVGRGSGGVFEIVSNVTVWNSTNDRTDLLNCGSAFITPSLSNPPIVNGKNSMFVHAANYLAKTLVEPIRLVSVATGSQPISAWASGSVRGAMYMRMAAILAAAGISNVDAFLWHQGETDEANAAAYPASWASLLALMQTDGYISSETPVVIGELAPIYPNANAALRSLVGGRVQIAPIWYFDTFDETHFTGSWLVRAGWEYARLLLGQI